VRDRSTYAMSFACAFTTEAFIDLSRTFLQAVQAGEVENQAPHSAEGTVRLDDAYHLHRLAHGAHDAAAQALGALGPRHRGALRQALGASAVLAMALLALAHLAFVNPFTQLSATQELSRAVYEAGGWASNVSEEESTEPDWSPTIVRLEVINASWPELWLIEYIKWVAQQALPEPSPKRADFEASQEPESANRTNASSTAQGLGDVLFGRLAEFVVMSYNWAFPVPQYEIMYGANSGAWLGLRSTQIRAALGVRVVPLRVSAWDRTLFGPRWAREMLSVLRLYDVYVLNALPSYFVQMHGDGPPSALRLHVLAVNSDAQAMDLAPLVRLSMLANGAQWPYIQWLIRRVLSVGLLLPVAFFCALLLSAALRRLLVLCVRLQVYSSYTLRQMRRYPFIAAPLRRVNCYSSNELLEHWTASSALAALASWLLSEAARLGVLWAGMLLCYALAEFWGIVHVRTVQSRWIFPRAMALLHGGILAYATWWPHCPTWLLLWTLVTSQLFLMFTLLCHFDCYAALPPQPPHRLLLRSSMLPAVPLSRHTQQRGSPPPGTRGVDKAVQTSPAERVEAVVQ